MALHTLSGACQKTRLWKRNWTYRSNSIMLNNTGHTPASATEDLASLDMCVECSAAIFATRHYLWTFQETSK